MSDESCHIHTCHSSHAWMSHVRRHMSYYVTSHVTIFKVPYHWQMLHVTHMNGWVMPHTCIWTIYFRWVMSHTYMSHDCVRPATRCTPRIAPEVRMNHAIRRNKPWMSHATHRNELMNKSHFESMKGYDAHRVLQLQFGVMSVYTILRFHGRGGDTYIFDDTYSYANRFKMRSKKRRNIAVWRQWECK